MKNLEHRITSSGDPDISLYIRERKPSKVRRGTVPLLLVHGATIPSVLWDNPLAGWSWMDRLADDGFHVFAVDLRGYGGSSRPDCFALAADETTPYARAVDVLPDVTDTISHIQNLTGVSEIDLFGGSWGSIICGQLVAENPSINIRKLVQYAPLYSETNTRPVWLNGTGETPLGAFRNVSLNELRKRWDAEIPVDDKSLWRSNGVLEALVESCVKGEAATFQVPNGTILDLHEVYAGRPLYDASDITIPTLLLRGSADPTSTHGDASRLFDRIGAAVKRYTIVGNGAHFMIAENKIAEAHAVVTSFLAEEF